MSDLTGDGIGGEESGESSTPKGTSNEGTVINLAQARHQRKGKEQVRRGAVLRNYVKVMLKDPLAFTWPAFPAHLKVIKHVGGGRSIVEVSDTSEVTGLTGEGLLHLLTQYSEVVILTFGQNMGLKVAEMKEVIVKWTGLSEVIDEKDIAPVRFLSDPGYTYRRLDFDPNPLVATPTFDEMFNRIDNSISV